jgi:hypothetical protein
MRPAPQARTVQAPQLSAFSGFTLTISPAPSWRCGETDQWTGTARNIAKTAGFLLSRGRERTWPIPGPKGSNFGLAQEHYYLLKLLQYARNPENADAEAAATANNLHEEIRRLQLLLIAEQAATAAATAATADNLEAENRQAPTASSSSSRACSHSS